VAMTVHIDAYKHTEQSFLECIHNIVEIKPQFQNSGFVGTGTSKSCHDKTILSGEAELEFAASTMPADLSEKKESENVWICLQFFKM
jgi:hypothetical protein